MELQEQEVKIVYPSIIFRLKDDYYSVGSEFVQTIMQMPAYKKIPNSDDMIRGMFMLRDVTVPMLDMRVAFSMKTVQDEFDEFADMIDQRKADHVNWVEELRKSVATGSKFALATDAHKCEFGRWYDNYDSEHNIVISHLNQIELPHHRLHNSALVIEEKLAKNDEAGVKAVMDRIDGDYMPKILNLLEETKQVYREAYREMILVLQGRNPVGLIVDEVVAVEVLTGVSGDESIRQLNNTRYIAGVKKSAKLDEVIMDIDARRLLGVAADMAGPLINS